MDWTLFRLKLPDVQVSYNAIEVDDTLSLTLKGDTKKVLQVAESG